MARATTRKRKRAAPDRGAGALSFADPPAPARRSTALVCGTCRQPVSPHKWRSDGGVNPAAGGCRCAYPTTADGRNPWATVRQANPAELELY